MRQENTTYNATNQSTEINLELTHDTSLQNLHLVKKDSRIQIKFLEMKTTMPEVTGLGLDTYRQKWKKKKK